MTLPRKVLTALLLPVLFTYHTVAFAEKEPKEIIILHVNDMHSKIDNMARLAYLADSLRRSNPYVFLVSAGDNFTGNPVVDMIREKGFPMVDLMNRCGFQVSAVGNHEFDMGQELLNSRMAQASFPFICCNLDASGAVIKPPSPYVTLAAGTDTIVMLGLIQLDKNGLPSAHPANMAGIRFVQGLRKAKEYTWLKERYHNLVALSHLGLPDDKILADSLPQFDLIIGGHSHTLLEQPVMQNGVTIAQAGSNLRHVGKLTLKMEEGKIIGRKGEVIPFSALKSEDPEIKTLIDQYNNRPEFMKVIGQASGDFEGAGELGSMMTDALVSQLQVDIALQNKGGIRLQSMPAGNITLKDIYKLDPFNNQVVIFTMNTEELASILCYGYELEDGIDIQVSGMAYEIEDDGSGRCKSVRMVDSNGLTLDPKREYLVAMNNYMAYTYQFKHRDPGAVSTLTTAEALIKYLSNSGPVNYSGTQRAFLKK